MLNYKKILPILSLGLLLAGCQNAQVNDNWQTPEYHWKTKAEKISRHGFVLFAAGSSELTAAGKRKLDSLFAGAILEWPFYSRLYIRKVEDEKDRPLADARILAIKKYLHYLGVKKHRIETMLLNGLNANKVCLNDPNAVLVYIDQYRLILPECPGWYKKRDPFCEPKPEDNNFGCASERNKAFMIAEPKDLYESQHLNEADGQHNLSIVEVYKTQKPDANEPLKVLSVK